MSFASILRSAWSAAQADARRQLRINSAVVQFNSRWQRLNEIRDDVVERFVKPLLEESSGLTALERYRLTMDVHDVDGWMIAINDNIETASRGCLSRYATSIKRLAIRSIKLCRKYGTYSGIISVEYQGQTKVVVLNGTDIYWLG